MSIEDYREGVDIESVEMVRYSPNVKQTDKELRECANDKISHDHVNEVILLDGNQNITEGSRSNIFFVKGNCIYTPPADQILKGITRDFVKEIVLKNEFEWDERSISLEEISQFDYCFLSSTTRGILPVRQFNDQSYITPGEIVNLIIDQYYKMKQTYIKKGK